MANSVTYNIQSESYTIYTTESASELLHKILTIYYGHKYFRKIVPEIEVVFISDPKDITREH